MRRPSCTAACWRAGGARGGWTPPARGRLGEEGALIARSGEPGVCVPLRVVAAVDGLEPFDLVFVAVKSDGDEAINFRTFTFLDPQDVQFNGFMPTPVHGNVNARIVDVPRPSMPQGPRLAVPGRQ